MLFYPTYHIAINEIGTFLMTELGFIKLLNGQVYKFSLDANVCCFIQRQSLEFLLI